MPVALTIDSLSEVPVNSTTLNLACQGEILGRIEHVKFAFLTQSGTPIGRARGSSRGWARAATGEAGPASITDVPGTRCWLRGTAGETRSRF
jgi:hypothetical protein